MTDELNSGNHPHVQTRHPLYSLWAAMIQRCTNPKRQAYKYYGARGISVHPTWRDFKTFLKEIPPRPSLQHTLDRIDPNGNYESTNIRWATPKEQAETKRLAPNRKCENCGAKINGDSRKGQCHACNEYYRRNNNKRPIDPIKRKELQAQKVKDNSSLPVIQLSLDGEPIKEFSSAVEAGKALIGKKTSSINNCLKGRTKTAIGYKWKYANPRHEWIHQHPNQARQDGFLE